MLPPDSLPDRREGERRGIVTAPRDPSESDSALHQKLIHLLHAFGYETIALTNQSSGPDPNLTQIASELGESSLLIWDARRPDDQVKRDIEFASEQGLNILVLHQDGWDEPPWWKLDMAKHYRQELIHKATYLLDIVEKVHYIPHREDPGTVVETARWLSLLIEDLRHSRKTK